MTRDAIPFTKMHGIGNDYVYINGFELEVEDPGALSRAMSPRHTGIGSDGVILILPPEDASRAHVRMRMFNADGSESEMCGNGVRCVCKYAHDHGLATANPMLVETGAGVLALEWSVDAAGAVSSVTVDMGAPVTDLDAFPIDRSKVQEQPDGTVDVEVDGQVYRGRCVSMGNPHVVFFVDDVQAVDLADLGPRVEHHAAFPERINAHFVEVRTSDELIMRTWERGSGPTLACGTGASAVCVAGVLDGRTESTVLAHLPGGDLELRWDGGGSSVFMTGTATEVFQGSWPADNAAGVGVGETSVRGGA